MKSLRGVFPEPKMPPKRNYVLENRRMSQNSGSRESKGSDPSIASKVPKANKQPAVSKVTSQRNPGTKGTNDNKINYKIKLPSEPEVFTRDVRQVDSAVKSFRSLAVQTVVDCNIMGKTDYILYPKAPINLNTQARVRKTTFFQSSKLTPTRLANNVASPMLPKNSEGSEDEDFSGADNVAYMSGDIDPYLNKSPENETRMPLNVSKPVTLEKILAKCDKNSRFEKAAPSEKKPNLPNYLKMAKKNSVRQEAAEASDDNCPDGHVTLPDGERKETLAVLRSRFADLVSELNKMPVRTDTLRQRKRKVELEQELCKLEEGIKVFSRHRVYVKVNM